jgi:hypothetical protein
MIHKWAPAALAMIGLVLYAGCSDSGKPGPQADNTPKASQPKADQGKSEHEHKPGAHGGLIATIGREKYHAEAIFGKEGIVKLFTLQKDAETVQHVDTQVLEGYARAEGSMEDLQVELHPVRQRIDPAGKASLFVGKLPEELWNKAVNLSVAITINGESFRFRISNKPETGHSGETVHMPPEVKEEDERELFFKPAGKYTQADIEANGTMTASQKFKGVSARHDLRPKSGDKVCPITLTKANPKFTWIVDGQAYQFCCPPCIAEFVQVAKEQPDELRPPGAFVKK